MQDLFDNEQRPHETLALDQDVESLLQALQRERAARIIAERRSERLFLLQKVTDSLSRAVRIPQAARVIVDEAVHALGARCGILALLNDEDLHVDLVAHHGYSQEFIDTWNRYPLDTRLPSCDAIKSGQAIWLSSPEEYHTRYPILEAYPDLSTAVCAVPIVLGGRPRASLVFGFDTPRDFDSETRGFITSLAQQGALAMERAYLFDAAQQEIRERNRHLGQIEALNDRLRRAMTETHHRVKNNLQIMAAMVDMQLMEAVDSVPARELVRLGSHIRTLAIIHELLTERAKDDGRAEDISSRRVLEMLLSSLKNTAGACALSYELDDIALPSRQSTSLALITNELVSNAIKHGRNEASVQFRVQPDGIRLLVTDDGPGFQPGFDAEAAANTGLELVENLTRWDLNGTSVYRAHPSGGGVVEITFPAPVRPRTDPTG